MKDADTDMRGSTNIFSSLTSPGLSSLNPGGYHWRAGKKKGQHDFHNGSIPLRVDTLPSFHSDARRDALGRPNAYTSGSNGYSGHVASSNRSSRPEWHTARAAPETECAIPSTGELVRFCQRPFWSVSSSPCTTHS